MKICFAELVAGLLDRGRDRFERVFGRFQIRRETAFVADRGGKAAIFQHALQRMKDFRAVAKRFAKSRRAFRHDHEFLEIDRRIGMRAAVEDVHHRHRQHLRVRSRRDNERAAGRSAVGRGMRDGERNAEECVRAEFLFVRRAVELDHLRVEFRLFERIEAFERRRDRLVHARDRFASRLCRRSVSCRHRAVPTLRARRCSRRSEPPRGRTRRHPDGHPLRPSGCRANRESRARGFG